MDRIPDGDWYCYECLNKVSSQAAFYVLYYSSSDAAFSHVTQF